MADTIRLARLLAVALAVSLLAFATAAPAAADPDTLSRFDALVLVSPSDLPELLTSGYLGDYAVVTPAELGSDENTLEGTPLFDEYTVLTPGTLGLDQPDQRFGGSPIAPFWRGFTPIRRPFGVPIVRFQPPLSVPPAPVLAFRRVGVVVVTPPVVALPPPVVALPPPPPPVVSPPLLPPPPALAPPGPSTAYPAVPIIPEADSLLLLGGGLAALALLARLRAGRAARELRCRREDRAQVSTVPTCGD